MPCGQAVGRRGRGRQDIDIHLLKPARFRPDPQWALPPAERDGVVHEQDLDPEPAWISYEYRTAHPVLRWLPTKLAEWISVNLSDELRIPDKNEDQWTAAELNSILINIVVRGSHGHLRTFGGIRSSSTEGPRRCAIPSTSMTIVFETRTHWQHTHRIRYSIRYRIRYSILYRIRYDVRYGMQYS